MEFLVRVLDASAAIVTHTVEAPSMEVASRQVSERGLKVLTIAPKRQFGLGFQNKSLSKDFPLGQFSHELLTLLDAGLSLVEAIETLAEKEYKPQRKELLSRLINELYQGAPLSRAIAQFPHVFPPLYIATVRASERTGGLSEALEKYVAYQNQIDIVRKKIISSSIYPAVLGIVGSLVIAFLLGYVVPRFSRIFESMGGEVPWMSRMLIQWGHIVTDHGTTILLGVVGVIVLFVLWLRHPATPAMLLRFFQRIPTIGERIRIYQLTRFYRSLGMLLRGGMPAVASLELVMGVLPGALNERLILATQQIREGAPISVAMERNGLTSPVSVRMLRVGERTGQMGEMMERIALFYDEEISQWVDWFVRLFEPLLMAFIGLVIGFIVVVMYFPIFELAGSIK